MSRDGDVLLVIDDPLRADRFCNWTEQGVTKWKQMSG
jgi:hypothetical protein